MQEYYYAPSKGEPTTFLHECNAMCSINGEYKDHEELRSNLGHWLIGMIRTKRHSLVQPIPVLVIFSSFNKEGINIVFNMVSFISKDETIKHKSPNRDSMDNES